MANGTRKMARGERLRWLNRLTVQEFNDKIKGTQPADSV